MRCRVAIVLVVCLLLAVVPLSEPARAGTAVTVSTVGQLRAAIDAAAAAATGGDRGPHLIRIQPGTYQLTGPASDDNDSGSLAIAGHMAGGMSIELRGLGAGATVLGTLEGAGDRVLAISGADLDVTVANLTFSGGRAVRGAGVSLTSGPDNRLELVDMTLSGNVASGDDDYVRGGGLRVEGAEEVVVRRSRLVGNTAEGPPAGSNAEGGGAYIFARTIHISDTEIRDSSTSAPEFAAGALHLMLRPAGTAVVQDSTLAGNDAEIAGAGYAHPGLHVQGTPGEPYDLTVRNTTVASNTATGPGIRAVAMFDADALLEHVTIAGNDGFGLLAFQGTATVRRTVVAGSGITDCASSAGPSGPGLVSGGHNRATDGSCGFGHATDLPPGPVGLGPLADHGGPTWTMAPQPGSALLDAAGAPAIATDQRGLPRVSGGAADIGAHEHQAPSAVADTATVAPGATVHLAVLDNDLAGEDSIDAASVSVVMAPGSGTVGTPTAAGAIPYTAPHGHAVAESFTYRVCQMAFTTSCDSATVTVNPGASPPDPDPERGVVRLSGPDRIATAVAVSQASFGPGTPVAYVATAFDFPDALAGGPAAGRDAGPVLLTLPGTLPEIVSGELARLDPDRIVVLGGRAAVSDAVEVQLGAIAAVERLAGPDRFATAAEIAGTFAAPAPTVYVATGLNFPDALSGAAAAARIGAPILLTLPDSLPAATRTALTRLDPEAITVLGGAAAVSPTVEAQLAAIAPVTRLSGPDRYATSAVVAGTFPAPTDVVLIATGQNFPDALAGAAAAAISASPVLLVPPTGLTEPGATALERLAPLRIAVLGGEAAVPAAVETSLAPYLRE